MGKSLFHIKNIKINRKNNKIIIYLKMIIRKLDKYIEKKNGRKYKKLETSILKNVTSSHILKNTRS